MQKKVMQASFLFFSSFPKCNSPFRTRYSTKHVIYLTVLREREERDKRQALGLGREKNIQKRTAQFRGRELFTKAQRKIYQTTASITCISLGLR